MTTKDPWERLLVSLNWDRHDWNLLVAPRLTRLLRFPERLRDVLFP
jgi:hypothetical protein